MSSLWEILVCYFHFCLRLALASGKWPHMIWEVIPPFSFSGRVYKINVNSSLNIW